MVIQSASFTLAEKANKSRNRVKEDCLARGWIWDEKTQTCTNPNEPLKVPEEKPIETPPRATPTTPETFTDPRTGRASGITLPDGRTFLGLGPEDVDAIAAGEARRAARPEGTVPVGTAQEEKNKQFRIQRALKLAQEGLLTQEELQSITGSEIDISQALGAGGVGIAPGLLGGAATGAGAAILGAAAAGAGTGAALGAATGPGVVLTAGIGALTGFLIAVRSNIKSQQSGEFQADREALTKGERYLRSLITDTNQNPDHAPENIALFYQTLNLIDAAHMKTYKDSQENLNRFLGNDGTPQLAKFDVFDSTMRQYYISQFDAALNSPDPTRILITSEDIGEEE